jgi:hypothetical protein
MKFIVNVLLLATLLLLVLFYFNSIHSPLAEPVKVISHQSSSPSHSGSIKSQTQKSSPTEMALIKKQPESSSIFINFKDNQANTDAENLGLDYVTAYREWQYFANCYTDVEDFHNETDPLLTLANRFETNTRESQDEPTQIQNSYYEMHVQECHRLIEDESDDYYTIMSKLKQRFESIQPETEKAKNLQHALEMAEQLERFKFEYSRASHGQLTNTTEEARAIQVQIDQLSDEILYIYESNDQLTEVQAIQIESLSNEIEQLRIKQVQSRVVNEDALQQANSRLDGYFNSIDDFLVNNQSPDAFLILAKALYEIEYFSKETTILKQLKNQIAIYDTYFINLMNQAALPLVACSMGYPCDSKSELVISYCLGLKDSMFIQACDTSLQDFFFNFYIGPNQRSDVQLYYNYLMNKYVNHHAK